MHFSLVAGLTFRQGQRTLELVRELDKSEYLIEMSSLVDPLRPQRLNW